MSKYIHKRDYRGVRTAQADGWEEAFTEFFGKEEFDIVIELGTLRGGLTILLAELCGSKLHTFDIKDVLSDSSKHILNDLNVSVYVENIFDTDTVKNLIRKEGRVLLLCDNGNKPKEVKLFTPFLKKDDVIMAHDYHLNKNKFNENKHIWRHFEISEKDMNYKSLKSYEPYYNLFKKVFWGCKIKE
jgi:predicted O-methyltransferase YrrM